MNKNKFVLIFFTVIYCCILLLPTGCSKNDAFEKGDGDVMTDAVVRYGWFYIPLIYGKAAWKVKGDVVKTREK